MDKLRITGIEVSARIGLHAWERQVRQRVSIDVELATDVARVAATDDIGHALDYGAVARCIVRFVGAAEYRLIETLAERIAQRLLDEFPVERLKIVLHKPSGVLSARDTSIEIERTR